MKQKTGVLEKTREKFARVRKSAAEAVRSGKTVSGVAKELGIARTTVKSGCLEHGVPVVKAERVGLYREREAVRKAVASAVAGGKTAAEACQEFRVSIGTVRNACREFGVAVPGRALQVTRSERRRQIAEDVRSGKCPKEVAVKYKVTTETVRNACSEHKVRMVTQTASTKTFRILAELLNTKKPYLQLAQEFGVTKGRVSGIYREAVQAGIQFPPRNKRGGVRKERSQP